MYFFNLCWIKSAFGGRIQTQGQREGHKRTTKDKILLNLTKITSIFILPKSIPPQRSGAILLNNINILR